MQILGSSGLKNSLLASSFSSHLSYAGSYVLVIDGEGGDEDGDAIDYIHGNDAVVSKMAVDEQ